ncbi:fumarylacetoacetate hydrolase family protein [Nocardia asiatica]|uniref:fumarylacetoacetate hydrolase family protein n=1 Tax=Nocardia asiatica TaxID=209252 RepID=UPI000318C7C3|nr:fumarylacetoacetate hydrolase family protein [Nocardia asiatica]
MTTGTGRSRLPEQLRGTTKVVMLHVNYPSRAIAHGDVPDLSAIMTLEAGDVILTGTSAGAGIVEPGDEVTVELVGLSAVTTTVTQSDAPLSPLAAPPGGLQQAEGMPWARRRRAR